MSTVNISAALSYPARVEYMAIIEDKIAEIRDPALRQSLLAEVKKLKSEKKFGLVFEEHVPELAAIYAAPIRPRATVARKTGNLNDTYFVERVDGDTATVIKDADGTTETLPLAGLVVVKRFGEPIYPALIPIDKVERGGDTPYHTLIEADNYHALQLLEYAYAGQVDVIYIDPPYNTRARDWKYNNRYVDNNDSWRHSKWLSMMRKRLVLAIRLLKPGGVMVVTIDDYEEHRLRCLIEDCLPDTEILGVIPIRNNPSGRATVRGFSISHEYAIFISKGEEATVRRIARSTEQMQRFPFADDVGPYEWRNFRKDGGEVTYRSARPKQFYPIYVTKAGEMRIPSLEWDKANREWIVQEKSKKDETVLWPIDENGNERVWSLGHESARKNAYELEVRWLNDEPGIYRKNRPNVEGVLPRTWWDKKQYSAREYGSTAIKTVFGQEQKFPFAKSVYAVADCLSVAGAVSQDALIVDFFAGSGTTLHAMLMLNATDGGQRQCILVTNNEVSDEEAKNLTTQGFYPQDPEWEAHGICRSVTFPRCKYVINGQRDNGTALQAV